MLRRGKSEMGKVFGWAGRILRVNLNDCSVSDISTMQYAHLFIGGRGIASRMYWEEITSDTGAFEWDYTTGGTIYSSPLPVDIDNDNVEEILFASNDGNFYCLDNIGSYLWNYPLGIGAGFSAVAADIDNDNTMEVVVADYGGKISAYRNPGIREWLFFPGGSLREPLITDLDSDNNIEIISTSSNGMIFCLDGTGGYLWSNYLGNSTGHPIAKDLDGDGNQEILVGTNSGILYCLDYQGNKLWNYTFSGQIFGKPVVVNLDADDDFEIIVPVAHPDNTLYCLDLTITTPTTSGNGGIFDIPFLAQWGLWIIIGMGVLYLLTVILLLVIKKKGKLAKNN